MSEAKISDLNLNTIKKQIHPFPEESIIYVDHATLAHLEKRHPVHWLAAMILYKQGKLRVTDDVAEAEKVRRWA